MTQRTCRVVSLEVDPLLEERASAGIRSRAVPRKLLDRTEKRKCDRYEVETLRDMPIVVWLKKQHAGSTKAYRRRKETGGGGKDSSV